MIDGRKKKITKDFGNNLKRIRAERDISLRDLAAFTELEHSQISRIEKGLVNPMITTVVLLAEALNVHPGEFFGKK